MRLFHSTNYPFGLILLLAVCICANTFADTSENNSDADKVLPEPHRIVENITNRLLSIISDEKLDPIQNPDEFYDHANEILESVVAFDYIAKGVMGNYADQVTSAQLVQFVEVFKKGLSVACRSISDVTAFGISNGKNIWIVSIQVVDGFL